jgi:hypothetical protein
VSPRGDWLESDLGVYVPTRDDMLTATVLPRSGIVGTDEGEHVRIDFEGNKFRIGGLDDWVRRVERAAYRHAVRYPTIARMLVPHDGVARVGSYDGVRVWVDEPEALGAYLRYEVQPGPLETLVLPDRLRGETA